jgi:hypothetical protein
MMDYLWLIGVHDIYQICKFKFIKMFCNWKKGLAAD